MERQTVADRRIARVLQELRLREAEQAHASYQEELDRRDESLMAWYASRLSGSRRDVRTAG